MSGCLAYEVGVASEVYSGLTLKNIHLSLLPGSPEHCKMLGSWAFH